MLSSKPLTSLLGAAAVVLTGVFGPLDVSAAKDAVELPYNPELAGTWASKSGTVMTGPDFFDHANERLIEPRLPGISYSFTADGYFEEAQYIVIPEPAVPSCPRAMLQFQHGRYKIFSNSSMVLYPIVTDGRQLLSDPCQYKTGIYTRYNSTTVMKGWEVKLDTYRNKKRLNLFKFDGSPVNPMWLVDADPTTRMLPTSTLRPVPNEGEEGKGGEKRQKKVRLRRSLEERVGGLGWGLKKAEELDPERILWIGIGLTALGAVGFFCV